MTAPNTSHYTNPPSLQLLCFDQKYNIFLPMAAGLAIRPPWRPFAVETPNATWLIHNEVCFVFPVGQVNTTSTRPAITVWRLADEAEKMVSGQGIVSVSRNLQFIPSDGIVTGPASNWPWTSVTLTTGIRDTLRNISKSGNIRPYQNTFRSFFSRKGFIGTAVTVYIPEYMAGDLGGQG